LINCRNQHVDGGSDGAEVAVRGGACMSCRPQPIQRELSGTGAWQLCARCQVG